MFVNSDVSYSLQASASFWEASEASRERTWERVAKQWDERDSSFPRLCVSVRFPLASDFPPLSLNPSITPTLTLPPLPPTPKWELGEVSLVRSCESWKQISLTFVAISETSVNIIQFYFFFFAFETVTFRPETFRFKARTTTSTRFDLKLLLVFLKYRLPGKLHFTIFH